MSNFRYLILCATMAVFLAGCNSQPAPRESPESASAKATAAIDPATAGSISGVVKFSGAAPVRQPIDMDQDPACALGSKEPNFSEALVVNQGKLQNVFLYVKEGLENYALPSAPAPAVLDQKGCRYSPHVLGMVAGQTLRVLNSDLAEHNVHFMARNNAEWNESQMPRGAPKEHAIEHAELLLPVTCNQHPWMKMYVNVVNHPFFAVSDAQGHFAISGLPPGEYTLAAVHEKLGTQSLKIKVAARRDTPAEFTFNPAP